MTDICITKYQCSLTQHPLPADMPAKCLNVLDRVWLACASVGYMYGRPECDMHYARASVTKYGKIALLCNSSTIHHRQYMPNIHLLGLKFTIHWTTKYFHECTLFQTPPPFKCTYQHFSKLCVSRSITFIVQQQKLAPLSSLFDM